MVNQQSALLRNACHLIIAQHAERCESSLHSRLMCHLLTTPVSVEAALVVLPEDPNFSQ
jgi:hypothetical protein